MKVPDVTGFYMEEAVESLKASGVTEIHIIHTAPPRKINDGYGSHSRVIRQRRVNDGKTEELTVSNENV